MNDNFDLSASDILVKCLQVLELEKNTKILNPSQANPSKTSPSNKNMYQLPFQSYFSPHQQAQNKKILQRLRRKTNKRKQSREVLIRKTDLGQNQLIFTKQQLERLQQIDQQEMYGPNYFRQGGISKQKPSQDSDKKYFINNPQQNQHEQILKYLQWVDITELKNNKDKKKSKILNFQKRQTSPATINHNKRSRSPLPLLLAKHSSPFKNLKTLQLLKAKSCYPLISKNSVDKGFLNSINVNDTYENRRLSQKEHLNQIIAKVNQKIEKELSSSQYIYMTEERKQALFQCQVLRRVKREIGSKFFNNLQLKYGSREKTQKTQQDQDDQEKENAQNGVRNMQSQPSNLKKNSFRSNCLSLKQKTSLNPKQKPFPETQAQKMIQKNRNRLKQQRKRVIQRIMC